MLTNILLLLVVNQMVTGKQSIVGTVSRPWDVTLHGRQGFLFMFALSCIVFLVLHCSNLNLIKFGREGGKGIEGKQL